MEERDYRYERKFLVEGLDAGQVAMLVRRHPGMFYERYPPRYVNNLYLDTVDLDNYFANITGAAERYKVRVRWYGEPLVRVESPHLEIKVKRGMVGTKHTYPFPEFGLDGGFDHRAFGRIILASDLPDVVRLHLRGLNVVLCNRYYRRYFATRDQRFRITVDTDMSYYRVRKSRAAFGGRYLDQRHVIVELKYDRPLDSLVDKMASFFPFIVTRSSKYVTGIKSVYL